MKINHLTATEENLMKLLWELKSFYLKDIMEFHPEPKPHQNTVSTYLKILVEKGYVSIEKQGRIFKYSITVPCLEYKKFLIDQLCYNFFNDSGAELLEFLVHEQIIPEDNLLDEKFDIKRTISTVKIRQPEFEYADEILNTKKAKKKFKDKKKKKKKA